MEMKFFRFLYEDAGGCFVHFGEIRDTRENQQFKFLYLKGIKKHARQVNTNECRMLFLCPKDLNLVILGSEDDATQKLLEKILEDREVETLVIGDAGQIERKEKYSKLTRKLVVLQNNEWYQMEKDAIWNIQVKGCEEGELLFMHGLTGCSKHTFDDCVMGTKIVDEEMQCRWCDSPDGYGCALGCTLHKDYDVCKYVSAKTKEEREGDWVIGTIVIPEMKDAVESYAESSRFFVFPFGETKDAKSRENSFHSQILKKTPWKKYYIGLKNSLTDVEIAKISKSDLNNIPVMLGEDEAICCAGLLRYREQKPEKSLLPPIS